MKVDYCSDLHVDAWSHQTSLHDPNYRLWDGEPYKSLPLYIDWRAFKNPDSQVLVIAGDISDDIRISLDVVAAAAAEYDHVVVVEGNHDHYSSDMSVDSGSKFFEEALKKFSNVTYLNDEKFLLINGVAFIGNLGWYDFKAYQDRGITDFQAKAAWNCYSNDSRLPIFGEKSPESLAILHSFQLSEMVRSFSDNSNIKDIVVVTHMSPRADLMEWKEGNHVWNLLTPSYVNTSMSNVLDADASNKIKYWVYGHTHTRQVVELDGVTYLNNARGYPRENPPFSLAQFEIKNSI